MTVGSINVPDVITSAAVLDAIQTETRMWNLLPGEAVQSDTTDQFKTSLKSIQLK